MESRTLVFGDIHGCYLAADAAVKLAKKEKAKAIFLGDYVDRGPDSIKTLEILIEAKRKNPEWIFLRGNHDQMLLDLIMGIQEPNIEFDVYAGRTSNIETSRVFEKWKYLSASRKNEITKFLENTIFFHETNDWIFVHAPLKNSDIPIYEKSKEELLWNYDLNPVWEGKQFVHGHATTEKLVLRDKNGLNINTSCGYGGVLTGLLIKKEQLSSTLTTRCDLICFAISESGTIEKQYDVETYYRK
jgi:serine/threonine protein phosphatase 1